MSTRERLASLIAAAAFLAAVAVQDVARAELIVLDPGPSGHRIGAVLRDEERLSLPQGTRMQVILPSGTTRTLTGPIATTAGEVSRGVTRNAAAWTRWLQELAGSSQSERKVGGTRGATR